MSLFNLAFVIKTQKVNKGGLIFQSAARHEGKPAPLLTMNGFITNKRLKSHLQLLEVVFF